MLDDPNDTTRQDEQSVLGAVMLSRDAIGEVADVLRVEDFADFAHQAVYQAVLDLYNGGAPVDEVTVTCHAGPVDVGVSLGGTWFRARFAGPECSPR